MLIIRLARIGKKKQPVFRLIINEKTKDTRGDYLENLGFYDPRSKQLDLKVERIKYWLSKGAQTSATIHNFLVGHKIVAGGKKKASSSKKKGAEATPAAAPAPKTEPKPEVKA